jgi:ATP dependent DNA ligase domain
MDALKASIQSGAAALASKPSRTTPKKPAKPKRKAS